MTDFLLELLSEEIPARMQEKAAADLVRLFEGELARAGLRAEAIESFVTPRRLALIARGLPEATAAISEEIKGPRADAPAPAIAGFLGKTGLTREQLVERADAKGNAVLFAVIDKPGRPTPALLAEAIPAIVRAFPWPKAMRWGAASLSTESLRWVRPLQGIVALFGQEVVRCEIAGIVSGAATVGHRFHHPGPITIGSAADYAEKLRACHVLVDAEERRRLVREGAEAAARAAGLTLVPDEGLVAENAGLTEWPVPLLGRFDPAFLSVPREVIQLTMRTNQKYFACVTPPRDGEVAARSADGGGSPPGVSPAASPLHQPAAGPPPRAGEALAPAFVCVANIEAADGGAKIVEGNAKVLAARLSDARFFWEQDLKVPLEVQAQKLDQIVFHEKLGTVADKVARVAKLARWLVEEGIISSPERGEGPSAQPMVEGAPRQATRPAAGPLHQPAAGPPPRAGEERARLADLAEQAARLCKADLVTGMVGEFPELQGVMGGYYARAEGLPDEVADAIRDHYKPVGQGDDVPTAPVTVAVSLADKLDTLSCFFGIDERPTGSRDPFALRRAALGVMSLILEGALRCAQLPVLKRVIASAPIFRPDTDSFETFEKIYGHWFEDGEPRSDAEREDRRRIDIISAQVVEFLIDRLKVQQREAGVRHDLIDAVFALGGEDDLVRLLARVRALQAFVETDDGANLLAGYRRAANILKAEAKKDGREPEAFSGFPYAPEPAEAGLAGALDAQLPLAEQAIAEEDFEGAMTALSVIRPAIDRFFDDVTVNSQDETQRKTRLALLAKLRAAMHKVADFSKIEG